MAHNDFDEDSDWTTHAQQVAALPSRRPQQVALVIFGMALGAAAASAVWFVSVKSSSRHEPPVSVAAPAAVTAPAAAPAAVPIPAPAPAVAALAPSPSAPAVIEADARASAPTASAPRPPPALSAAEVARRKELAWSRYYKRPPACEGNPNAEQLIDCANHFVRAKREFDERWRAGTL